MRAKELARQKGRQRCDDLGLILLDDSVALKKLKLTRSNLGHVIIWRKYQFEFSSDGGQRYRGEIILSGKNLLNIIMDAYRVPSQSADSDDR